MEIANLAAAKPSAGSHDPVDLTNKSVVKATVLLTELGHGRHGRKGMTATELAQAVGMTRATTFRLLLSLEQSGFVDRVDTRYQLGWQMARLGRLADPYRGAVAHIQPILDTDAATLNETLSFAMQRSHLEFDLIAEASGARMLNVTQNYIGRSWPLHASATGKIMLAELDDGQIRAALPDKLEAHTTNTIASPQGTGTGTPYG